MMEVRGKYFNLDFMHNFIRYWIYLWILASNRFMWQFWVRFKQSHLFTLVQWIGNRRFLLGTILILIGFLIVGILSPLNIIITVSSSGLCIIIFFAIQFMIRYWKNN